LKYSIAANFLPFPLFESTGSFSEQDERIKKVKQIITEWNKHFLIVLVIIIFFLVEQK
jgi:hypothetical protein